MRKPKKSAGNDDGYNARIDIDEAKKFLSNS
jgi:hypothetical protein